MKNSPQKVVVLLHGILQSNRSLKKIEVALRQQGYIVLNLDYPSRGYTVAKIAQLIYQQIQSYCHHGNYRLYFVTHSMGGLVVRHLFDQYAIANCYRIVMLGPPHHGSPIVDFFKQFWMFRWLYGLAGQKLTTEDAYVHPTPDFNCELGIIAGSTKYDPFARLFFTTKNDGRVAVSSTYYPGMCAHLVVPMSHTLMLFNYTVIQQVQHFLENGFFLKLNT